MYLRTKHYVVCLIPLILGVLSLSCSWQFNQKDTRVETTYGKAQRGTGGIGPVMPKINWGGLCSSVDGNRLI